LITVEIGKTGGGKKKRKNRGVGRTGMAYNFALSCRQKKRREKKKLLLALIQKKKKREKVRPIRKRRGDKSRTCRVSHGVKGERDSGKKPDLQMEERGKKESES